MSSLLIQASLSAVWPGRAPPCITCVGLARTFSGNENPRHKRKVPRNCLTLKNSQWLKWWSLAHGVSETLFLIRLSVTLPRQWASLHRPHHHSCTANPDEQIFMERMPAEQAVYGRAAEESRSLSRLTELIEVSIGHANSILYSIEDITRLPNASPSCLRNRDSGYSEGRGPINGDDLSRRLLSLERKVEDNRAYLRDLQRAKLSGLQGIIEEPEGQYASTTKLFLIR